MRRAARPTLADLTGGIAFDAGDRIVIKTVGQLTPDKIEAISRGLRKFAKVDVNIMFVDITTTHLQVVRKHPGTDTTNTVAITTPPKSFKTQPLPHLINIDLAKVDFWPDDLLLITVNHPLSDLQRREVIRIYQRWAGDSVDIKLIDHA